MTVEEDRRGFWRWFRSPMWYDAEHDMWFTGEMPVDVRGGVLWH